MKNGNRRRLSEYLSISACNDTKMRYIRLTDPAMGCDEGALILKLWLSVFSLLKSCRSDQNSSLNDYNLKRNRALKYPPFEPAVLNGARNLMRANGLPMRVLHCHLFFFSEKFFFGCFQLGISLLCALTSVVSRP